MVKKRQQYSSSFKAKVALEAIKEDSTLAQLSAKYHVNPTLISKWKVQALQGLSSIFSGKPISASIPDTQRIKELHAKIGELTVERDFLEEVSVKLGLPSAKKW
jgi:transposase